MPYGSMLHIPLANLFLLAAKQEPCKKSLSFNEKYWKNFLEKVHENGPAGRKKKKTERVIGLGRRTRQEIVKWNQMAALRFQTGGRYQTSPASLLGGGGTERERESEHKSHTYTHTRARARTYAQTRTRTHSSGA